MKADFETEKWKKDNEHKITKCIQYETLFTQIIWIAL